MMNQEKCQQLYGVNWLAIWQLIQTFSPVIQQIINEIINMNPVVPPDPTFQLDMAKVNAVAAKYNVNPSTLLQLLQSLKTYLANLLLNLLANLQG